jgi:hypothetical protein
METTFLDRLIKEKEELLDKVTKLATFLAKIELGTDEVKISDANHLLLKQQLVTMNDYLNILIIRIELNK